MHKNKSFFKISSVYVRIVKGTGRWPLLEDASTSANAEDGQNSSLFLTPQILPYKKSRCRKKVFTFTCTIANKAMNLVLEALKSH